MTIMQGCVLFASFEQYQETKQRDKTHQKKKKQRDKAINLGT